MLGQMREKIRDLVGGHKWLEYQLILICIKLAHQKFSISLSLSQALAAKEENIGNEALISEAFCVVFFEVKQLTVVRHTLAH